MMNVVQFVKLLEVGDQILVKRSLFHSLLVYLCTECASTHVCQFSFMHLCLHSFLTHELLVAHYRCKAKTSTCLLTKITSVFT